MRVHTWWSHHDFYGLSMRLERPLTVRGSKDLMECCERVNKPGWAPQSL